MTSDSRFGWTKFYMEFADKLLDHKGDRRRLVAKVREVCNNLGYGYLDNSGTAEETTGLPDICPFTTMGTFNRNITSANRKTIATEIGNFLGVTEPVPDSFDGIPTLNNLNSVVFWDRSDIDPLWQVFKDAIQLTDSDDEDTRQSFVDSYDRALRAKGVGVDLTMGLFWIRPGRFMTLDGKSSQYIASSLGFTLPSAIPPQGHEYLKLADDLTKRFGGADFPVHSFQELSLAAYERSTNAPVWVVRAGRQGQLEDAAIEHHLAIVDWGVADLTGAVDTDAVREQVRQDVPGASNQRIGNITSQLASFLLDMGEGDIVVLPLKTQRGRVAIGRITGPYTYREVGGDPFHTRPVNWIRTDVPRLDFGEDLQSSLGNPRTICRIQGNEAERRIAAMLDGNGEVREYTVDNIIADGCFLEESRLKTMLARLKTKKNLILQGPPGTGKTWLAKKLAFALIGEIDERRVRPFQFHPNMSYEDFIRGFRPDGDEGLTLVDGPFLEVVKDARCDTDSDYVMVIEEINRGNPAQIFGEMLTLLEADKRSPKEALTLAYPRSDGERVYIPPNVYVIGTMNVADRSIALVDLALRRRFAFIDLAPTFGAVWRDWVHEQCGIPLGFLTTVEERMNALNKRIAD